MNKPTAGDLMVGIGVHNVGVNIVIKEPFEDGWLWTYQVAPWNIKKATGWQVLTFLSLWKKIGTACVNCGEEGCDDSCLIVDGRDMEVVNEYASTCDGCAELTMHREMEMDPETQLGYCKECMSEMEFENERK